MQAELTQSDVEWLRCLTISRRLTAILPEHVRLKLESARLLEGNSDNTVITESGAALLHQPQAAVQQNSRSI